MTIHPRLSEIEKKSSNSDDHLPLVVSFVLVSVIILVSEKIA